MIKGIDRDIIDITFVQKRFVLNNSFNSTIRKDDSSASILGLRYRVMNINVVNSAEATFFDLGVPMRIDIALSSLKLVFSY